MSPASRAPRWIVAVLLVWLVGFELHNTVVPALPDWAFGKFPSQVMQLVAATLCALRATRLAGLERTAWGLIAAGMFLWTGGDLYWTFVLYDLEQIPIPSPADAGYLLAIPFLFSGLVVLARARFTDVPRTLWLDGLVAALAAAAVSAAAVFGHISDGITGTPAEVLTNLAYPVGDLALLAVIVGALALGRWRLDATWGLLGLGILSFWAADSLYLVTNANGTYVSGGWFDAGWNFAYLAFATVAWVVPRRRSEEAAEGGDLRLIVVPLLFALVSLGMLGFGAMTKINVLAGALATASMLAVLGRLILAYHLNADLLHLTRHEAMTDALTGLPNRRALTRDLERACHAATLQDPKILVLFDLDGFKHYNDSFGHAAGDALLVRLGHSLGQVVTGRGTAYRMGGDEFCALLDARNDAPSTLARIASKGLTARGEGFFVGCSFGVVALPAEVQGAEEALRIADHRMYAQKRGGRASVERQSKDVLLRVLAESSPDLEGHTVQVASLAAATAQRLGLGDDVVRQVQTAAELHDVGKVAIPDDILDKPGPLDDAEWGFMRRHTLIGERIVAAAPALDHVAKLVRSSHERWDGTGYPDRLAGEDIPEGARIVAVCDAFDAMISDRPYSRGVDPAQALAELRRCAGSQFDPVVVEAFALVWAQRGEATLRAAA